MDAHRQVRSAARRQVLHHGRHYTEAVIGLPGTGLPEAMRDLLALLEHGGVILTANARAARALHRRHAEAQPVSSAGVWRTPHILDLESWLAEQWHALLMSSKEDRLLLNIAQEQALWERIVAPSLAGRSLIAPAHMTSLAQQAYALLAAHRSLGWLDEVQSSIDPGSESELFRQWSRNFRDECRRRRWLPRCELSHAVTTGLRSGVIPPPERIGWLGFDRHTPAEQTLMAALDGCGCPQQELSWDIPGGEPTLHAAASAGDEASACAEWTRAKLAANPAARIGILAPELSAIRPQLERALFRTLAPHSFAITAGAPTLPFEFAVGMPLAETSLVRAALLLLCWLQAPLPQQEITWLLLSGMLGALRQNDAREGAAEWDARLRDASCAAPEMSLDSLIRQRGADTAAIAPLRQQFYAMLQTYRRYSRNASASGWAERIDELLGLAQWGAVSDASSLLYQVRQAWGSLLEIVSSLDFAGRSFTYPELLAHLERIAGETVFAPESEDAPVQVMGAFAAAGQSFNAVWFLSASGLQWPSPGRPHPLLPLGLQRDLAMPHTTPAVNTQLAHRITARVLATAGDVVFSYAAQGAEGILQQPSPLISGLAHYAYVPATVADMAIDLERIADDTWVPHPNAATTKGGQRALKRQADCPFQAFAFQRLGVRELPLAGRGLSPMERGKVLHEVLQNVWSEDTTAQEHLTDRATLRAALASETLQSFVAAHAAQAFAALNADRSEAWQRAYLAAEEQRLVELVMEWLAYEATRQEFRVLKVEEPIHLQIGELALTARADRIDEVPGGFILIDYKSGEVNPASWDGPRPAEPQLPLYAAFGNVESLVGALFAQMRRGNLAFKGRVQNATHTLIQSLPATSQLVKNPYGPHLLDEWRASLTALAENFVRGEAQVDPREYPGTCKFCPLPGLCRVAESTLATIESLEEEESA